MACSTGPACGFTATRSCGRSTPKYSAVMMAVTEAQEAWWPPTLVPSGFGRMWLAWWIIHDASHSSLRSMAAIASSSPAGPIGLISFMAAG